MLFFNVKMVSWECLPDVLFVFKTTFVDMVKHYIFSSFALFR